jgi:hypothetical protein
MGATTTGGSTVITPTNSGGNTVTTSPIPTIGSNGAGTNPTTVPIYPGN